MMKAVLIGCGMIACKAHIPAYKSCSDVFEIAAVCDVREEMARKAAEENNIPRWYADAETMLREEKPDVVSVCAPNMLHKQYAMLALSYGANVLCEKPLALAYADAKEMFDLAAAKGKVLMACQTLRFLPERQKAHELIASGSAGEIYYAELSRIRRRGIPTWGKFHIKEASGGGALVDIGVHGLDSALWLMGNPKPVSVRADLRKVHADEHGSAESSGAFKGGVNVSAFNPDEMNVESFSSGTVSFAGGAALSFKVAWAANLREENNIVLAGEKLGLDLEKGRIYRGSDEEYPLDAVPNGFTDEPFFGHFCLVRNMADVLTKGVSPAVLPEETLRVTAVLEAAYRSAELKREVAVRDIVGSDCY